MTSLKKKKYQLYNGDSSLMGILDLNGNKPSDNKNKSVNISLC